MTQTNTEKSADNQQLISAITVLSRFLCVEDQLHSAKVVALFPQKDGLSVTRYAGQVFQRVKATLLFIVGGTEGIDVDEARTCLKMYGITEQQIIDPKTQMNTRLEIEECLRVLRAQHRETLSEGIVSVSVPHKALRYRAMLQQAAPGVPVFAAPPRENSMAFLPDDFGNDRSREEQLLEALAMEVKEIQRRLLYQEIRLPDVYLQPLSSQERTQNSPRFLRDTEIVAIAERYYSAPASGDRRTIV